MGLDKYKVSVLPIRNTKKREYFGDHFDLLSS